MSKAEIKKKFDAIVAFAEVDKFLDTPVKRYSSGMGVRLAFSVAAVPAYFYPYYFLLGTAGFYHALNGLSIALPRLGLSFRLPTAGLKLAVPVQAQV